MSGNKNEFTGLLIVTLFIGIILGGIVGFTVHPDVEIETITDTQWLPAEKCEPVNCIPTETIVEIPLDAKTIYLTTAIADFKKEFDDIEDITECGEEEYDEDQIAVKKIYDGWSVTFDDDETIINFETKLKYLDKDTKEKCYNNYNVQVTYEQGEKPVVEILE